MQHKLLNLFMQKVPILLSFLLHMSLVHAQSFSNLGFEYWQGDKYPLLWQHPAMTVTPDSVINLSGRYSLKGVRLHSDVEQDKSPYGLVFQDIASAFNYSDMENKKVSVSVQIKSKTADSTMHVGAFIQIIDRMNPKNNNISIGNDVAGKEWTESSTTLTLKDVAPASTIYMGVIMMGCGEIWLDNYQVKLNEESSQEASPRRTCLTGKEKEWLEANIIPVSDDGQMNKKQIGAKLSDSRIVGVGDNVHGSASIVQLKNMVTQALIEQEGFTLIAIEDSPDVGEAVNRYIQGTSNAIRTDINLMYANKDFMNFLNWLRDYNESATKKVRIFGVDVNSRYQGMIDEINKETSGKYSSELDSIHYILKTQIEKWENAGRPGTGKILFSEEQKKYLRETLVFIKKGIVSMDMEKEQGIRLCYYANHLLHYLSFDKKEREKQMADNISQLLVLFPDEKIVYLAHNLHVGNNSYIGIKSAGAWLKEHFLNKYYIIGTCYFDGTDCYKRNALYGNHTVINESVRGSYEYLFNQIKENCFFLDLSCLHNHKNEANEWLDKPMLMRSYGVEPFNYYHEFSLTNLLYEYDGVLFIKRSVPL